MSPTGRIAASILVLAAALAACNGAEEQQATGTGPVTLRYWLWDSAQQPAYEECAEAFEAAQGDVRVNIQQFGWNDYWANLTTGMAGDTAPDVFTNHLAHYPLHAENEVLIPLNDFIERENFDTDQYFGGLAELWTAPDGSRYGLPKDWDTVSVVFDEGQLAEAGVAPEDLWEATWNPDDGGTFEDIVARLTVDANGVRGDEPGFNPSRVEVYGLGWEPGALAFGQTMWGGFVRSLGFELLNENPWGDEYRYDDPRFVDTIGWYRRMIEQGYMPPFTEVAGLGQITLFQAGRIAMAVDGSWMIGAYTSTEGVDVGFAPQPRGPEGSWSVFNGLADSIWEGTDHPEEAWEWVRYLASIDCQRIVGEHAVVFPAIPEAADIAFETLDERGIDASAFMSYLEEDRTVLHPITNHASFVNMVVTSSLESVMIGDAEPQEALDTVTQQINARLQ